VRRTRESRGTTATAGPRTTRVDRRGWGRCARTVGAEIPLRRRGSGAEHLDYERKKAGLSLPPSLRSVGSDPPNYPARTRLRDTRPIAACLCASAPETSSGDRPGTTVATWTRLILNPGRGRAAYLATKRRYRSLAGGAPTLWVSSKQCSEQARECPPALSAGGHSVFTGVSESQDRPCSAYRDRPGAGPAGADHGSVCRAQRAPYVACCPASCPSERPPVLIGPQRHPPARSSVSPLRGAPRWPRAVGRAADGAKEARDGRADHAGA
jgi:hypothetical protein